MLGVAFGVGVLLALAGGTADHDCVAPHPLVSDMTQRLEESVDVQEPPNPSVLLAMNLAGAASGSTHKWLLHEIQEEAVKRAQKDMTSGEVALYVLALLSSCKNPRHVQALGQTVDLVDVLQKKTEEEVTSLEVKGVPKTTLYGMSLATLGLCLAQAAGYQEASVALAKQLLDPERDLSVDTRAMAVLALACAYGRTDLGDVRDLLWEVVSVVTNGFLDEQEERDGMMGNIYSMGLALQALEATGEFYDPRKWDCAQAFSVVYKHHYSQPTAIAQVLPALVGKTYLDAAKLDCASAEASIKVQYSVINNLRGPPFSCSISVEVPHGSVLLKVLEVAEEKNPQNFTFQTEQTSWGPMVVSIHGLAANTDDRTYWQFFGGQDALQEGVGTYKPRDGEHIKAIFSTY